MKVYRNSVLAYRCDKNIPKQLFKHPGTRMKSSSGFAAVAAFGRSVFHRQHASCGRSGLRQRVEYLHGSQAGSLALTLTRGTERLSHKRTARE